MKVVDLQMFGNVSKKNLEINSTVGTLPLN